MIEVGFAELHNPLFLGGKNFGLKLDSHRHPELKIVYDKAEKELLVTWLGKTAFIPSANVAYYVPGKADDRKIVQVAAPQVAHVGSAQVETPMSHVHRGEGHGKTGVSLKA